MVLAKSPFDDQDVGSSRWTLSVLASSVPPEFLSTPPTLGEASVLPYYAASWGLDKSQPWEKFRRQK